MISGGGGGGGGLIASAVLYSSAFTLNTFVNFQEQISSLFDLFPCLVGKEENNDYNLL